MSMRIQQLSDFLRDEPNDPFLLYSFALEHVRQQPAEANRLLDELLIKLPDYLPTYYQSGLLKIQLGQPAQAKIVLERGLVLARAQQNIKTANELRHLLDEIENEP